MLSRDAISEATCYVLKQTRHVIETFGPRTPGSPAEREAQGYVAECLEAIGADEIQRESFPVAAKAFMGFQPATGIFLLLSAGVYWLLPLLALFLSVFGFMITWFEFVHYRLFLDRFFPKSDSENVYARWSPEKETKRRIILNGHIDAAFEWRYNYRWPKAFPWLVRYGLTGLVATPLIQVAGVFGYWLWPDSGAFFYMGIAQLLFVPSFILTFFYTDFSRTVPGANDNLSGVFIALGVAKALREAGVVMEHTELACLITGSEEAGIRGAKAWAAKHRGDFEDYETVILTLDTLHDVKHMTVFEHDLNGTVHNDGPFSELVQRAAAAKGYDIPRASIPLGSTDAAAFSQAGLTATALCAMDPAPADFYHTRRDNWDNMNSAGIAAAIGVVEEVIRMVDAEE